MGLVAPKFFPPEASKIEIYGPNISPDKAVDLWMKLHESRMDRMLQPRSEEFKDEDELFSVITKLLIAHGHIVATTFTTSPQEEIEKEPPVVPQPKPFTVK